MLVLFLFGLGVYDFDILAGRVDTIRIFAMVMAVGETGWIFAGCRRKGSLDKKFGGTS